MHYDMVLKVLSILIEEYRCMMEQGSIIILNRTQGTLENSCLNAYKRNHHSKQKEIKLAGQKAVAARLLDWILANLSS